MLFFQFSEIGKGLRLRTYLANHEKQRYGPLFKARSIMLLRDLKMGNNDIR